MTTTPVRTSGLDRFFSSLDRIPVRRSTTDRHFGGVCGGLARSMNISPTVVRLTAIALAFFGIGVPVYLVAWLLLPSDDGQVHLRRALRAGAASSIVLLVVTALALLPDRFDDRRSGWLVAAAAIAALVVLARRRATRPLPPTAPHENPYPTAATYPNQAPYPYPPAAPFPPAAPTGPQDAPRG